MRIRLFVCIVCIQSTYYYDYVSSPPLPLTFLLRESSNIRWCFFGCSPHWSFFKIKLKQSPHTPPRGHHLIFERSLTVMPSSIHLASQFLAEQYTLLTNNSLNHLVNLLGEVVCVQFNKKPIQKPNRNQCHNWSFHSKAKLQTAELFPFYSDIKTHLKQRFKKGRQCVLHSFRFIIIPHLVENSGIHKKCKDEVSLKIRTMRFKKETTISYIGSGCREYECL